MYMAVWRTCTDTVTGLFLFCGVCFIVFMSLISVVLFVCLFPVRCVSFSLPATSFVELMVLCCRNRCMCRITTLVAFLYEKAIIIWWFAQSVGLSLCVGVSFIRATVARVSKAVFVYFCKKNSFFECSSRTDVDELVSILFVVRLTIGAHFTRSSWCVDWLSVNVT